MAGSRRGSWASMDFDTEEGVQAQELAGRVQSVVEWREEMKLLLKQHEKRLTALEERAAGVGRAGRASRASKAVRGGSMASQETRASTHSTVVLDVDEDELMTFDGGDMPLTKLEKKRKQNAERITSFGVKISLYEFGLSMWDASILLFIGHVKLADRFLLVAGMIVNITMQSAMLAVVWRDMLLPDYNPSVTKRLLEWRVWNGHANSTFHQGTGETKVQMLCNKTLWSFEQEEYNEMYDYLYMPVPGLVLSFLAVVLWVLTCVQEYRCISEQFLALKTLPAVRKGEETVRLMEYGTFVLGIEPVWRWVSFFVLCLPRFAVLASLCTVGCIFLCQTVNLADIMLNAVALAFILDIDEALCAVMLSQRLRNELQLMQPMPCGETTHTCGGITYKDLGRYLLTMGIIATVTTQILFPFHADVSAAATALCGGVRDFTWSGGVIEDPMIKLTSATDWVSSCTAGVNSLYMAEYYAGFNQSSRPSEVSSSAVESDRLKRLTERLVISQALTGCPVGQLKTPKGECEVVPQAFTEVLVPLELIPGNVMDLPDCQRLNVTMGWSSCAIQSMTACKWTWKAHKCEAGVEAPGLHHQRACGQSLEEACAEWRSFDMDHPIYNCEAVAHCTSEELRGADNVTCLSLSSDAELTIKDGRFWENVTEVVSAVQNGIKLGLHLSDLSKVITVVDFAVPEVLRRHKDIRLSRRLRDQAGGPPDDAGELPVTDHVRHFLNSTNSTTARIAVQLRELPKDMKTEAIRDAGAAILASINQALESSLGLADAVEGFNWQGDFSYASASELLSAEREDGGYCNPASKFFNCLICRQDTTSMQGLYASVDRPPDCCQVYHNSQPNRYFNRDCCDACWTSVVPQDVRAAFSDILTMSYSGIPPGSSGYSGFSGSPDSFTVESGESYDQPARSTSQDEPPCSHLSPSSDGSSSGSSPCSSRDVTTDMRLKEPTVLENGTQEEDRHYDSEGSSGSSRDYSSDNSSKDDERSPSSSGSFESSGDSSSSSQSGPGGSGTANGNSDSSSSSDSSDSSSSSGTSDSYSSDSSRSYESTSRRKGSPKTNP